jgi:hypothetical protein
LSGRAGRPSRREAYWRDATPPPLMALHDPSPVGRCRHAGRLCGDVSLANYQSCRKTTRTNSHCCSSARPESASASRPGFSQRWSAAAFTRPTPRELRTSPGAHGARTSCRDRRLIEPATVHLPAIYTDARAGGVCVRFRRAPVHTCVRTMTVVVPVELEELPL